jgi:multiple sugar transport system permease protein
MNTVRRTLFALFIGGIVSVVLLPLVYFASLSFSSNFETSKFPSQIFPSFSYEASLTFNEKNQNYSMQILQHGEYAPTTTFSAPRYFSDYLMDQLNVKMDESAVIALMEEAQESGKISFSLRKSMFRNFEVFFIIAEKALPALMSSLKAALWTILISLSLGGMAGYTLARMQFRFKNTVNIALLLVRMFPAIAISLPMVIYAMRMELYDTPLSLALVYSVTNIALTAWITNSIFSGISVELEEAALIFGANRFRMVFSITLPLALPAVMAASLYAFLTAWNDSLTALLMTNENPTLALLVYRAVGSTNVPNLPAAGAIVLLIPSLIFTFIIKKYIKQLWGNASIES